MFAEQLPASVLSVLARTTDVAARAAAPLIARKDGYAVDRAAVDVMRSELELAELDAVVVTGEGAKDAAPMIGAGEHLGRGGPAVDLAIDPIDGTSAVAAGAPWACSAIGATPRGAMFDPGPLVYAERVVVGPRAAEIPLGIDRSLFELTGDLSSALSRPVGELVIGVLERPRNAAFLRDIVATGARAEPLRYCDLAAMVATVCGRGELDAVVGIGGAPETLVAACAVVATGGAMRCRLFARDQHDRDRAAAAGLDLRRELDAAELVGATAAFAASGVTPSPLLAGVTRGRGGVAVQTLTLGTGCEPSFQTRTAPAPT